MCGCCEYTVCVCVCVSNQCRRRACRKADSPSMTSRMATVRMAKAAKMIERPKNPPPLRDDRPKCMTMDHRTSDSSAHTHTQNNAITTTYTQDSSSWGFLLNKSDLTSGSKWKYREKRVIVFTYVHGPGSGPRVAGRRQCWRCNPDSTLWCGWPGEQPHLQNQTVVEETTPHQ